MSFVACDWLVHADGTLQPLTREQALLIDVAAALADAAEMIECTQHALDELRATRQLAAVTLALSRRRRRVRNSGFRIIKRTRT